jgi:stage III sporulation protein SpoIIIAA
MSREFDVVDLSGAEQRVLQAIAELESRGSTTYLRDIARHSGLDEEQLRPVMTTLTRDRNLVSEVPGGDPDLGEQYVLHDPH